MILQQRAFKWLYRYMILAWLLFMDAMPVNSVSVKNIDTKCKENERQVLLRFKQGIFDDGWNLLSSWDSGDMDCCRWRGINCDDKTRHIIALDLAPFSCKYGNSFCYSTNGERLKGKIDLPLLELPYLSHLDLSGNDFTQMIQNQRRNLSRLKYVDLGDNESLKVDSLEWISGLSSLTYLKMNYINLVSALNWLQSIQELHLLESLLLSHCQLLTPSLENTNSPPRIFESLQTLDLSYNSLTGDLFEIVDNIGGSHKTIKFLKVNDNKFSGSLAEISRFTSLLELHLQNNQFVGSLPDISKLSSLEVLNAAHNNLNGSLVNSFGGLSNLTVFDVSFNSLEGSISESYLLNLSKLQVLDLSQNLFTFSLSLDWVPPFQLTEIRLSSCNLGPNFPAWIQTQKTFEYFDISINGISGSIPNWFWNLSAKVEYWNLSHNSLNGTLPNTFLMRDYIDCRIDLSHNKLDGVIPQSFSSARILNLSKNKFSVASPLLCANKSSWLWFLDLSDNMLSGTLSKCHLSHPVLSILSLANNHFSGEIPSSIGSLVALRSLNLRNNSFTGELPPSLSKKMLKFLDLGENKLSGRIPGWIGESLSGLIILSLQSNEFHGEIPSSLCFLESLQVLDLSLNSLFGEIPSCFNNFTAMYQKRSDRYDNYYRLILDAYNGKGDYQSNYKDSTWLAWRGIKTEYQNNLALLKLIDLSSNELSGEIPTNLTSLYELISLNLSRNNLIGNIPEGIGQLTQLNTLDLSNNQLSGEIPFGMTKISFLGSLDLSNNDLSGIIPKGTQLQSFPALSYAGNPQLCGPPLSECPGDGIQQKLPSSPGNEDDRWLQNLGLYVSVSLGFIVGFWGVSGTLLLKGEFLNTLIFQLLNRRNTHFRQWSWHKLRKEKV